MSVPLAIIVPAHDEAAWLAPCLDALFAAEYSGDVQVIVVANGCHDDTADVAREQIAAAHKRDWRMDVIDTPIAGKLNALNMGDALADTTAIRVYLDADVIVSPPLLGQLVRALDQAAPRYASGSPRITPARSMVTRAYGRLWATLPFVTHGVPGFGLFAMNAAGRARWDDWPDIISDDTFARLSFTPNERDRVPATYTWPMVEGFTNLVRVRRRQNRGVQEIAARFPTLPSRDDTPAVGVSGALRRALRDPIGFAVYCAVAVVVKSPFLNSKDRWTRGR